ncbi:MAG: hypothetical protein H6641_18935 [Caldilineaceae bacterium]|nr:hypothetical protein [Caldilineaceae bacterium]
MNTPINDWENPRLFDRNKEPGRASFFPHADATTALAGQSLASPYVQNLNGDWRFHLATSPLSAPGQVAAASAPRQCPPRVADYIEQRENMMALSVHFVIKKEKIYAQV